MSRARLVGLVAACGLTGTAACGLVIGLEDHEAYPVEAGVVGDASMHDGTTTTDSGADGGQGGDTSVGSDASGDAIQDAGGGSCEATCGDACVDLQSDKNNCGTCGFACDAASCYRATCGGGAVSQLSAGTGHVCALLQAGDVWCWGADDSAQILGPADASACPQGPCRVTPERIGGLPNVVEISAGGAQTCALDPDGGIWCWGSNAAGGLGHSPASDPTCVVGGLAIPCNAQPVAVQGLPGPANAVTSGQTGFACAVAVGAVYCWGDDSYAEIGPMGNGAPAPSPQLVIFADAGAVAAGFAHACAMVGNTPKCWGSNTLGELGHAPGGSDQACGDASFCNPTPQALTLSGVVRIHPGYHGTCFETTSGPYCMGADDVGQLGLAGSDPNANPTPTAVTIDQSIFTSLVAMDYGYKTPCALVAGSMYCWGDDETHQTSDPLPGLCGAANVPCVVDGYRVNLTNVAEVRTSTYASYARTEDGRVWAWGGNGAGQLGHMPGDGGDEGGCDPSAFPSGTVCNALPAPVLGLP